MNEPDIAAAVEAAARATVAPPFGVVEHLAQVRRRRQIVSVAAAITAVLAGGALAVPRVDARDASPANGGRLKPYEEIFQHERDLNELMRCRAANASPDPGEPTHNLVSAEAMADCLRSLGYEPPPATVNVVIPGIVSGSPAPTGTTRCTGGTIDSPGTEKVREGKTRSVPWAFFVRRSSDPGVPCVYLLSGTENAAGETHYGDRRGRGGPIGGKLQWLSVEEPGSEPLFAVYGAVPKEADHVEITVEGEPRRVDVFTSTLVPGWRYVATMFPVQRVAAHDWPVVVYDAQGHELERYN